MKVEYKPLIIYKNSSCLGTIIMLIKLKETVVLISFDNVCDFLNINVTKIVCGGGISTS